MKDYLAPTVSTYQFFNLTEEQKKEFEEQKEFENWYSFEIDRLFKGLERKLRPIAERYGITIKIENYDTKNSLTIESVPHEFYKGPELWFESDFEVSEHLTCLLDVWKE
jgi:hypothetical protein